jgi:hypothetical protein
MSDMVEGSVALGPGGLDREEDRPEPTRSGVLASLADIVGSLFLVTSSAPSLNVNSSLSLQTRSNILMHLNWARQDASLLALRRQLVAAVCHSLVDAVQYRDTTYLDFSFLWSHPRATYLAEFMGLGYAVVVTTCPQDVSPTRFPVSQRVGVGIVGT